ncbi:hypothetical protein SAMN06265337_1831 [Hymenobacter gelipurpurascens]|uniref:Uncharacterized protein n=1 Tax=Hymenobacter gelipurpurascens TaxID=89968 RepID=A0A212TME8_9BACT|nr:hypothetical protein [Hymenobacter gelipurpurascens]SNC67090.1 hypothetical protein SAMN06265337_1831 [Hymenobacter gelipurpurascens]
MKLLSFTLCTAAILLGSCKKSTEKQTELAVQDFVRNRISDAKNYFPGKFRYRPYTKQDSLLYLAQMAQINGAPAPPAPTAADTARIGILVHHNYRDEMRNGEMIQDSGEYVVRPNGEVRQLVAESVRQKRMKQALQPAAAGQIR